MASHLHCGAGRRVASRQGCGRAAARSWAAFCGGASGSRAPRSRARVLPPCCTHHVVKWSAKKAGCAVRLHVDSAERGGARRAPNNEEERARPSGPSRAACIRHWQSTRECACARGPGEPLAPWRAAARPPLRARSGCSGAWAPATSGGRAPWCSCASAGWSAAFAARCAGLSRFVHSMQKRCWAARVSAAARPAMGSAKCEWLTPRGPCGSRNAIERRHCLRLGKS